jgi:hypothetical protein
MNSNISDFQCLPTEKSVEYTPGHINFRTRICRHYLKGYCNRGEKCNFAHGYVQVKKRKKQNSPTTVNTSVYEMKWGEESQYDSLKDLIDDYDIVRREEAPKLEIEHKTTLNIVKTTAYEYNDHIESCVI